MFGSLRKKLEELTAQVNPFDGGKTASTVRASRNQAPPAQTTNRPNQPPRQSLWNKAVDQVSSNTQADNYRRQQRQLEIQDSTRGTDEAMRNLQKQALTGQVDKNVAAAKIRALGTSNVQPNTAENVLKPTTPAQIAGQKVIDTAMNRKVAPVALGIGRSAAGTVRGVSGLYDLASPGDGVNRISKQAVQAGEATDRTVKDNNYNQVAYRGAQAATDLATFGIAGKATKAVPGVNTFLNKVDDLAKPVSNVSTKLATKGFGGRVAGSTLKNVANPRYQAANAGFTALEAGKQSANGQEVTPMSVTTNLVAGGVGFPVAGAVGKEVAKPIIKAGVNQLRKTNLVRPSSLNPNEVADLARLNETAKTGAIMDEGVYQRGVQAAQKAGVDYNNPTAVDDLLGKHRTFDTVSTQRKQAIDEAKQRLVSPRPLASNEGGYIRLSDGKDITPKKYKEKPGYAMSHRPNEGPRAFNLTEKVDGEQMIPDDMYSQWYGSRNSLADKQSIQSLKAIKDNPEADVVIYRASPKDDLAHGDWVTLSKDYATQHAEGQGGKVHSYKVKAKDLKWAMDDVNEFGFYPEKTKTPLLRPLNNEVGAVGKDVNGAGGKIEPMKLYHGSDTPDVQLKQVKDGIGYHAGAGPVEFIGPSLSSSKKVAQTYGKNIVEKDFTPKNPKVFRSLSALKKDIDKSFGTLKPGDNVGNLGAYYRDIAENYRIKLQAEGYDSIKFKEGGKHNALKDQADTIIPIDESFFKQSAPQVGKTPLAKDEIILYHRTSKANADELAKTGKMLSKENTGEVFLSSEKAGQNVGYGDTVVPVKVKKSDIRLDDEFPSGEQHFAVKADRATPVFDSTPVKSPLEQNLEAAGLKPTGNKAVLLKENTVQTPKNQSQSTPKTAQPVAPEQAGTTTQTKAPQTKGRATSSELGQDQKIASGTQRKTTSQSPEAKSNIVNPSIRERGFVETIIDDPKTSPKVKENLSSLYSVRNTKQLQTKAANLVKTDPDLAMRVAREDTSDIGVATGSELIKKLQQDGNYEQAIDLATNVAATLTKAGQTSQAASIYGRLTPEGILRFTQKEINAYNKATKKNIKLSPEQAKSLTEKAQKVQEMPEGRQRDIATQEMLKELYETMPSTWVEKVSTFQTMAQLLNPKTLIRNLGGNTIFSVLDNTSQVLATGIDKAISGVKGTPRTTTLPSVKTQAKGLKKGFNEGYEEAVKGINLGPRTQFELNDVPVFRDGLLGKAETGLNLSLRATDRAAYTAAFDDTLKGLMKTNNAKTPTTEMLEMAHHQGLYRTFQDDSNASKIFVGLKKALNIAGFEQNGKRWGLGDLILKYPKTPGNLIARGIDYSPVGILKGMIDLTKIGQGAAKQQSAANSIARGVTGTGSLIGTGYVLAGLGVITEKPEDNKDLRNLQKSAGLGGYQLNTSGLRRFLLSGFDTEEAKLKPGDKLVSYDWAQPAAIPLSMGASMGRGEGVKKGASQGLNALSEGVETLAEQPLVRGVQQFFGSNKTAIDSVIDTAKSAPASFVPTLSNQVRQLTDNTTRNTSDPSALKEAYNKAVNRVPGLAGQLPAQVDTLGNDKKNFQNGSNNPFNVFLNPSFVNKYQPNNVASTNLDLNRATGETKQLPNTVSNKVKINGQDKVLTGKEQGDYQRFVGQTNSTITDTLTKNPRFNALPDTQKVNLLASMQTDINNAAKVNLFGDNPEKLSESVDSILSGNLERAIELKLKTQEKTVQKKSGKKVAKAKKPKKAKVAKKGKGGKKGGKGTKKGKFDYTKNLFASSGTVNSGSNTKALRAILEKAQKA
jgi:hypothetical protein